MSSLQAQILNVTGIQCPQDAPQVHQAAETNGIYYHMGVTADGRAYYKNTMTSRYIYYDGNCCWDPNACVSGWIFGDQRTAPNTGATENLDGEDGVCRHAARLDQQYTEYTLPLGSKSVEVGCGGTYGSQFMNVNVGAVNAEDVACGTGYELQGTTSAFLYCSEYQNPGMSSERGVDPGLVGVPACKQKCDVEPGCLYFAKYGAFCDGTCDSSWETKCLIISECGSQEGPQSAGNLGAVYCKKTCLNTDRNSIGEKVMDSMSRSCDSYPGGANPDPSVSCGQADDSDFTATAMCCGCGGGMEPGASTTTSTQGQNTQGPNPPGSSSPPSVTTSPPPVAPTTETFSGSVAFYSGTLTSGISVTNNQLETSCRKTLAQEFGVDESAISVSLHTRRLDGLREARSLAGTWTVNFEIVVPLAQAGAVSTHAASIKADSSSFAQNMVTNLKVIGVNANTGDITVTTFDAGPKTQGVGATTGPAANTGVSASTSANSPSAPQPSQQPPLSVGQIPNQAIFSFWGDENCGAITSPVDVTFQNVAATLIDIEKVVASQCAWAALTKAGKVIIWGAFAYGGPVGPTGQASSLIAVPSSDLEQGIVDVVGTRQAFAALTSTGRVITWGDKVQGDPGALSGELQTGIVKISAHNQGFIAITSTGKPIIWGIGMASVNVPQNAQSDVVSLVMNFGPAFAAIKSDKTVVTWGEYCPTQAGAGQSGCVDFSAVAPQLTNIVKVVASQGAFAALDEAGAVVSWGDPNTGGSAAPQMGVIVDIFSLGTSFVAIESSGKMWRWSDNPTSSQIFVNPNEGIVSAMSNAGSWGLRIPTGIDCFCACGAIALDTHGNVQGEFPLSGGVLCTDFSDVQDQVDSNVASVVASHDAFVAIRNDGSLVGWGLKEVLPQMVQTPLGARTPGSWLTSRVQTVIGGGYGFVTIQCRPTEPGCQSCPPDQYWEEAQLKCSVCSVEQGLVPNADGTGCQPCGGKTYFNSESTSCQECAAGKVPSSDRKDCEVCAGDTYADADTATCQSCGFLLEISASRDGCKIDVTLLLVILLPIIFLLLICAFWAFRVMRRRRMEIKINAVIRPGSRHSHLKKLDEMLKLLEGAQKVRLKAIVKDVQEQVSVLENKYTNLEYIKQVIDEGNLKMVRGRWVIGRSIKRFPRQQDIPPDGFWTLKSFSREVRMLSVVAVSYCWLNPAHPDPKSEHIGIIKKAVKLRLSERGPGQVKGIAFFFDYMSLTQRPENGEAEPDFLGVRTPEEQQMFKAGISEVNVLYANQATETWILQWVPERVPNKYDQRAWPCFERTASSMIKDGKLLITLSKDIEDSCDTWLQVFEKHPERVAPLTPAYFEKWIETKHVTNGGDLELLVTKYKETFDSITAHAKSLWFPDLGWAMPEAEKLAEMLPFCYNLQQLIVAGNKFNLEAAMLLLKTSVTIEQFENMDLLNNDLDPSDHEQLYGEWERARRDKANLVLGISDAIIETNESNESLLGNHCGTEDLRGIGKAQEFVV